MATPDDIEAGCIGAYGKNWNGPPEKMPGERMKNVWRELVRKIIEAVDEHRDSK